MNGKAHDDPLEPGRAEGQPLGIRIPQADRGRSARPRDSEHARRRVDAPDAAALAIGQRDCETPRPTRDVEHPAGAKIAFADERLEELPPVLVDRPQLVVPSREATEVRRPR
jgi:hypothetical protein